MIIGGNIEIVKEIGKGAFGAVYIGKDVKDNKIYAVKKTLKKLVENKMNYFYFNNELYILKNIKPHPNVIKYHTTYTTFSYFFSVFDYCNGGTLDETLKQHIKKFNKPLPEQTVKYIVNEILKGIVHINKEEIIHRDIKSENILLSYENEKDKENLNIEKARVVIIDFGFARYLNEENMASSIIGTPLFMAPCILNRGLNPNPSVNVLNSKNKKIMNEENNKSKDSTKDDDYDSKKLEKKTKEKEEGFYDFKADIWSLGVLTYEILFGILPFYGKNCNELAYSIENRDYQIPFNSETFKVSRSCIKFIQKMLTPNMKERVEAKELIKDKWLTSQNINESEIVQLKNKDEISALNNEQRKNFLNFWKPIRRSGKRNSAHEVKSLIERLKQKNFQKLQNCSPNNNTVEYNNKFSTRFNTIDLLNKDSNMSRMKTEGPEKFSELSFYNEYVNEQDNELRINNTNVKASVINENNYNSILEVEHSSSNDEDNSKEDDDTHSTPIKAENHNRFHCLHIKK